ncbi:MAG: D-erythronate dehydrogenase [Beijerinckiaceae bacterium]
MHVLVIGAAGMIGRRLVECLLTKGLSNGEGITRLTLHDVIRPDAPEAHFPVEVKASDISVPGEANALMAGRPDLIFHLAAIVSAEAEANMELGYRVNFDGTRLLFEASRATGEGYCPRVVFASSLAVYGAPLPDVIDDTQHLTPLTSYGTQKAMAELLLADYTRRGILDGIGIRLPTICVRPGVPNKAASGFFSSIIREPLNGQQAILPVGDDVQHWFASPLSATGFLLHAAALDTALLGTQRNLMMPGVGATVGEQIEALRRIAGDKAAQLIRREPNENIARIIAGWPRRFNPARALALGFKVETTFDEIIRIHIAETFGGVVKA